MATARLGQDVGIRRVIDVAHRLGIESELPEVPSLALGAAEVSPLEMARAYATLANGGVRPVVRTFEEVVDADGERLERRRLSFERVLDEETAYLATSLLEGVIQRGTGRSLTRYGLTGALAGKTGTTDDERDAWFVGYTPELVVAVWVGFDAPQSIGLSGASAALPIWARFVKEATGGDIRGRLLPTRGDRAHRRRSRNRRARAARLPAPHSRTVRPRSRTRSDLFRLRLPRRAPRGDRSVKRFAPLLLLLSSVLLGACGGGFRPPSLPQRDHSLQLEDVIDEGDDRRRASHHLVAEGLEADDLGEPDRALDRYQLALSIDPGNPWAYLALARHELEGGEPQRALASLDRSRSLLQAYGELSPRVETHLIGIRGAAFEALGRNREAAALLEEARRRAPGAWGDGMLAASELR